jgi:hypothetical protein
MLHAVEQQLRGILHLAVVERRSGRVVASLNCELDVHGRFLVEVRKASRKAEAAFSMQHRAVQEVLIALTDRLQLMRVLPGGQHLLYAAADSHAVSPVQLHQAIEGPLVQMQQVAQALQAELAASTLQRASA